VKLIGTYVSIGVGQVRLICTSLGLRADRVRGLRSALRALSGAHPPTPAADPVTGQTKEERTEVHPSHAPLGDRFDFLGLGRRGCRENIFQHVRLSRQTRELETGLGDR
jgi:hypothetical protein